MSPQSDLILGTVQFGMAYGINGPSGGVSLGAARAILSLAWDLGIRKLDTAPVYGDAEARLPSLCGPNQFFVTSKLPPVPGDLSGPEKRDWIDRSIETSRARLGGMLRAVLFHRSGDLNGPEADVIWDSAAEICARHELALGVSSYDPAEVAALASAYPISVAQLPGNAFDQRLLGAGLSATMTLEIRSVFLQGLLLGDAGTMAARLPAARSAILGWHRWCEEQGLRPIDAAFAVARGLRDGARFVVGADSTEHLLEIHAAADRAMARPASGLAVADPAVIRPDLWVKTS